MDAYFGREPARITADLRDPMNLLGQEPLPPEWGDQMFVALQFLRSALEYVAFDLVMAYTPDANPSRTGFPVAKTEEDWTKSGGDKRFVANMHPGAAEIIEGLQPFNDVRPGYTSTLEGLHEFARIYRHRRPPLLLTAQRGRGVLHTDYRHPMRGNVVIDSPEPEVDYATPPIPAARGDRLRNEYGHEVQTFTQTAFHPEIGSGMGPGDGTPWLWVLRSGYRFVRDRALTPLDEFLQPRNPTLR
ncbi:hypothetical protein [Clavibacter nebraskensis]|uniref:hypothetical protein n=1 Tax=Clavibacter nebraskensis TaxID=31963 RepID=UPI003F4B0081